MKKIMLKLIFLTTALTLRTFGDTTSAPHTIVALSGMGFSTVGNDPFGMTSPGAIIVRVEQPPFQFEGPNSRTYQPIVNVHRYNKQNREYEKIYEFHINSNELAEVIVPDLSGQRLAFIYLDRGNAGLRVYSEKGAKSTYWPIKDFLKQKHQDITAKTATTIQWFDSGNLTESTFSFRGPYQGFDLTGLGKRNPEAVKAIREGYRFKLNLESGVFQEINVGAGFFISDPVKSDTTYDKDVEEESYNIFELQP